LDKKQRSRSLQLDEFRHSVRGPITNALNGCDDCAQKIQALFSTDISTAEAVDETKKLNTAVISALGKLSDRLDEADKSNFSANYTWLTEFNGFEDKILNAFNEALNTVHTVDKRKDALKRAHEIMRKLKIQVIKKIENELINHSK
jgi:hypothetical protein